VHARHMPMRINCTAYPKSLRVVLIFVRFCECNACCMYVRWLNVHGKLQQDQWTRRHLSFPLNEGKARVMSYWRMKKICITYLYVFDLRTALLHCSMLRSNHTMTIYRIPAIYRNHAIAHLSREGYIEKSRGNCNLYHSSRRVKRK